MAEHHEHAAFISKNPECHISAWSCRFLTEHPLTNQSSQHERGQLLEDDRVAGLVPLENLWGGL